MTTATLEVELNRQVWMEAPEERPCTKQVDILLERTIGVPNPFVFLKLHNCKVLSASVAYENLPLGLTLRRKGNEYGFTGVPKNKGAYASILTIYTDHGKALFRLLIKVN